MSISAPEQGIVATSKVMMCPPMGRGTRGELALYVNGRALFLSQDVDLLGRPIVEQPLRSEDLAHAKVRFGGRVDLPGGWYLSFGRKPIAQAFVAKARAIVALL